MIVPIAVAVTGPWFTLQQEARALGVTHGRGKQEYGEQERLFHNRTLLHGLDPPSPIRSRWWVRGV